MSGHRVCIDYRKLNLATKKDHYPLPFSDQILEKLARQRFYRFLDGYLTCHFPASLKHKDDGQTKFIKPNSQRQDMIIKYWVSIGRST